MSPSKATKSRKASARGKRLSGGKKVNEVKPLGRYLYVKGTKQNP